MLDTLNKLGHRISRLFGEPDLGLSAVAYRKAEKVKEHLSGDLLAHLLPYEWFDEEHGIFINGKSVGFAIEVYPLVGFEESYQKEVDYLFEEILEEGSSMQCLLFADHRIDIFLQNWGSCSAEQAYQDIIQKRIEFFSHSKKISPKLFRSVFSYTIPFKGVPDQVLLKSLQAKKEKMLKVLTSLSYGFCWSPKHLLEFAGGMVNFSLKREKKLREWNPYQTLASQLTTGGSIKVERDRLEWKTDQETHFKSFRVVDYPSVWSLGAMQYLIGDVMRDSYRLSMPFYLHYSVHCPNQDKRSESLSCART